MSDGVTVANLHLKLQSKEVFCVISGPGTYWLSPVTPISVDLAGMSGKIDKLKKVLNAEQTAIWAALKDPLAQPSNQTTADEFANAVERVVTEGATLYRELSDLGFRTILKKINSTLKDGDRLTIHTDSAFLPWEILYPFEYNEQWTAKRKEKDPLRPKALWGYRFQTNHMMLPTIGEDEWEAPIAEHLGGPVFISLNLNKAIEDAFAKRDFKPIDFHHQFFESSLSSRGQLLDDPEKIKEFLLEPNNKATIIYLYCHGQSTSLVDPSGDQLELGSGKDAVITPAFLDTTQYQRGPIVVLNSCSSAATSPLSFSSFHKKFRTKRAMGMVGTTIQIPATFAAAFGKKFIEAYLDGIPVAKAIYDLRRKLLDQNNPLGMFYSLQCLDYITAPAGQ